MHTCHGTVQNRSVVMMKSESRKLLLVLRKLLKSLLTAPGLYHRRISKNNMKLREFINLFLRVHIIYFNENMSRQVKSQGAPYSAPRSTILVGQKEACSRAAWWCVVQDDEQ